MLFDDAPSYTAFKSGCRLSQSATSPTPEYSLVSSAKLTSLDADTSLSLCKRMPWSVAVHYVRGRF